MQYLQKYVNRLCNQKFKETRRLVRLQSIVKLRSLLTKYYVMTGDDLVINKMYNEQTMLNKSL